MSKAKRASTTEWVRRVNELQECLAALEIERDDWKSLASQITTDWIPANHQLSERIAALEKWKADIIESAQLSSMDADDQVCFVPRWLLQEQGE